VQPFTFIRSVDSLSAVTAYGEARAADAVGAPVQYLAGGTTLLDLMKLEVMRPQRLVDINDLSRSEAGRIAMDHSGLTLGALAHMADVADHPDVRRGFPVIAQSLQFAASAQIRNMASLGGNVLQRTRCAYFRDLAYGACNKRNPGSGCAAMEGVNRQHAILGTSDRCIAAYPGDFAQALIALDAEVEVLSRQGRRRFPFADLHRLPGETPQVETNLAPGELILAFHVPAIAAARRSRYLKIRDRASYEFALASAAVALDMEGSHVNEARIALGGVATAPWRARDAELELAGRDLNDARLQAAAEAAFAGASPRTHNAYKVELGKRALIRAVREAAAMEI
jgi:xanthine dehydrogenase YagS FAD-binding subunit